MHFLYLLYLSPVGDLSSRVSSTVEIATDRAFSTASRLDESGSMDTWGQTNADFTRKT